jgi:hypothetical protein
MLIVKTYLIKSKLNAAHFIHHFISNMHLISLY